MVHTDKAWFFWYIVVVLTSILVLPNQSHSSTENPDTASIIPITSIIISGNHRTKRETILELLAIDTGTVYDTVLIISCREKLEKSRIFHKVKIYPLLSDRGATIFIAVKELPYLSLSSISGELFSQKYGAPERWWRARLGMSVHNFRGRNERLYLYTSFWDSRALGLSWHKPFMNTPYFLDIGLKSGSEPSTTSPEHNFYFNQFVTFGRKIKLKSVIYTNLRSTFNRHTYKGGKGKLTARRFKKAGSDSLTVIPQNTEFTKTMDYNITWDTTVFINRDTAALFSWRGVDTMKIKKMEEPYPEVFYSLGWITDNRMPKYNTNKGFYYGVSLTTNIIPYEEHNRYFQLSQEFRFYHRGIFPKDIVAYRLRPTIRLGTGGMYSGLSMGGAPTLRGYGSGYFGGDKVYNNRVLFSTEYRFHIITMPELHFPWLKWYHSSLQNFPYSIHGAFFGDCGYLWKDLQNPKNPKDDHRSGANIGAGIRVLAPSLQRSLCFDLAWIIYPEKNIQKYPAWALYIDLPF